MGLIEYVPAQITLDYLIVAINNDIASEVARYIHQHCKRTCGLFIAANTEYYDMLTAATHRHRRIIELYYVAGGTVSTEELRGLFTSKQRELRITVSSVADGAILAFLIGNHRS